ncbi:MAG: bis(5'-nucleosyl)-tetraphosphatase (symmetrical) YqeK [Solobacterium sp.]|nr:bis(5'-nucleosyl)-tetraphosphatase (symmetrical) YqeK [Solobacterium sp.]
MRRIGIVEGTFDPITESSIQEIRKKQKEYPVDAIVFVVKKEGLLSQKKRIQLVKDAIKRYRTFTTKVLPFDQVLFKEEINDLNEEKIREGKFQYAACGIKKRLIEEGLYLEEILNAHLKDHRKNHSIEVAKLCVELAKVHHVDTTKAYIAGMLHDITKNQPDSYHEPFLKEYHPEILTYNPRVWHSYSAPYFLKQELGINDAMILNAIKHHTLGTGKSKLDYILYIADKCEPTRGYDASKEIQLSKENLKKGFQLVMKESEEYRKKEK